MQIIEAYTVKLASSEAYQGGVHDCPKHCLDYGGRTWMMFLHCRDILKLHIPAAWQTPWQTAPQEGLKHAFLQGLVSTDIAQGPE